MTELAAYKVFKHKEQESMGGLMWRPLTSTKPRARAEEIRELADVFSADRVLTLDTGVNTVVGLYRFQSMMPGEKMPAKAYSFAAGIAKLLPEGLHLVVGKTQVNLQDTYCLVVVEAGVPLIDTALDRDSLLQAVAAYHDVDSADSDATVYCSEVGLIPGSQPWPEEWVENLFSSNLKLERVPVDFVRNGAIAASVCMLVAGGFFGYQHFQQQLTMQKLQAASSQVNLQEYRADVRKRIGNLGLSHSNVTALIDQLMDQPFISNGWILESIECRNSACQSRWSSEGGYTEEIIASLPRQAPSINPAATDKISFGFTYGFKASGLQKPSQLQQRQKMFDLLYDEQQAWGKAGVSYRLDLTGQVWPAGYDKVPRSTAVLRYPIEFSGEPQLVIDFLNRYGSLAYYENLRIDVNLASLTKAIKISVKGAFYAS